MKFEVKKSFIRITFIMAFILFALVPCFSIKASGELLDYDDVMTKIEEQKSQFPQGKYWNHYGSSTNNPQGWTNTPCPVQDTSQPWSHTDSCCNHYEGAYGGRQCMGFAKQVCHNMFGTSIWNDDDWEYVTVDSIAVGDYVRYSKTGDSNGHSFVVIAINGDTITKGECNFSGYCKIEWTNTMSIKELATMVVSANYSSSDSPASYIRHNKRNMSNQGDAKYNRSLALAYAASNWNNSSIQSEPGFLSRCLSAGGFAMEYTGSFETLMNNLNASGWGTFYDVELQEDSSIRGCDYNNVMSPGDVVFYYCPAETDEKPWVYCALCNGFDEYGYMKAFSNHNYSCDGSSVYQYDTCPFCGASFSKAKVYHFEAEDRVTPYYPEGRFLLSTTQVSNNTKNRISIQGFAFDRDDLDAKLDVYISIGDVWSKCAENLKFIVKANQEDSTSFGSGTESHHVFEKIIDLNLSGEVEVFVYAVDNAGSEKVCLGTMKVTLPKLNVALTGNVNISGTLKYGQTLTATVSNSNNTGTLSYQWKRGSTVISGATRNTYKLVQADIGNKITCEVKSSVQVGTISATTASNIAKADGPAAPTGMTAQKPSMAGASDGKITFTSSNTYQYANNSSYSNANKVTGTQITGLKAGTYYVRIAETETRKAGATATVTVPDGVTVLSGTVTISGTLKYGKTLTASVSNTNNTGTLSYQWKRGTTAISGATSSTYKLVKADIGNKISCVVTSSVESGSITGTTSGVISKADNNDTPSNLLAVATSRKGATDGKITNVTATIDYATASAMTDAKKSTGTTVTGLAAGTYYVRYAETDTHLAGPVITITVAEGPDIVLMMFDANGGSGSMDDVWVDRSSTYILPACKFSAPAGKTFAGWLIDGTIYNVGDSITADGDLTIKALWKNGPAEELVITKQPRDWYGIIGKKATFTVEATGDGLTYQWQYKKSGNWNNYAITTADTATFKVTMNEKNLKWPVRCVITDEYGQQVITREVHLKDSTVSAPITITTQPTDYTGKLGKKATFTVEAVGNGLTYQWQYKKGNKWKPYTVASATTATLKAPINELTVTYPIRCKIVDEDGFIAYTAEVWMRIKEEEPIPAGITITAQPSDYTGKIGKKASFSVAATGEGLTYEWQVKKSGSWSAYTLAGYDTPNFQVSINEKTVKWTYRCVIRDASGNEVTTAEVHIYAAE